jgi:hypothetical protein
MLPVGAPPVPGERLPETQDLHVILERLHLDTFERGDGKVTVVLLDAGERLATAIIDPTADLKPQVGPMEATFASAVEERWPGAGKEIRPHLVRMLVTNFVPPQLRPVPTPPVPPSPGVGMFDGVKGPGPRPSDPGPAPDPKDATALRTWRIRYMALRNWLRLNRRYQLAQVAKRLIDEDPDSQDPMVQALILLAAIVIADEVKPQGMMELLGR